MTAFKATKKPITVDVVLWDGGNHLEIMEFTECCSGLNDDKNLSITTLEGEMIASVGDFIIKGVNGEFYPCKPDIFHKTYDIGNEIKVTFSSTGIDSDLADTIQRNLNNRTNSGVR